MVFFILSQQLEKKINIKHQQLHMAKQLAIRNKEIDKFYKDYKYDDSYAKYIRSIRKEKGIYTDCFYHTEVAKSHACKMDAEYVSKADSLLMSKNVFLDEQALERSKLILTAATDSTWEWTQCRYMLVLKFKLAVKQGSDAVTNLDRYVKTAFTPFSGVRDIPFGFYLFFVLLLIAVFSLIKMILETIFPIDYCPKDKQQSFWDLLEAYSSKPSPSKAFIYAINLSGADRRDVIDEAEGQDFTFVDLSVPSNHSTVPWCADHVVLLNFDHNIFDTESFRQKIIQLERLSRKDYSLILSSKLSPALIFEFYKGLIGREKDEADKMLLLKDISRFKQVLARFTITYCSLQDATKETDCLRSELKKELKPDVYLASLSEKLRLDNDAKWDIRSLWQIQTMAGEFYASLWNSCSIEEKIILHDLAKEALINMKNEDVLKVLELLQLKGLVVCEEEFRIMNASLANYILTSLPPEELSIIKATAKEKSSWQSFRIPLILMVVGIFIFLMTTQQALMENLTGILISLGAVASVFVKVSGVFGGKSDLPSS